MCRSLPAAHLLLISCRPLFPMASTWTPKLSQMDPGKMKRCPRPYRGGDPLQWKRYEEEWNEETASERKKRAEISSSTLAGRVSECVRARWRDRCQAFRRDGFWLHVKLSNKQHWLWIMPQGNFLASVPEMSLIPVKLTLCKVSRHKLNPEFSL